MNLVRIVVLDALGRRGRLLAPVALWCTALGLFWLSYAHAKANGSGGIDAVVAPALTVVLPLHVYGMVRWMLGARSLGDAALAFVALGHSRALSVRAQIVATCALVATTTGLLGIAAALALRTNMQDAATCGWVFALLGVSLAALTLAGSTFMQGRGSFGALALNWLLGGAGVIGVLVPQGHGARLLGDVAVAGLSGRASCAALVLLTIAYAAFANWRGARERSALLR